MRVVFPVVPQEEFSSYSLPSLQCSQSSVIWCHQSEHRKASVACLHLCSVWTLHAADAKRSSELQLNPNCTKLSSLICMQVHDWTRTNFKPHPSMHLDKQWRSTKHSWAKSQISSCGLRNCEKRGEEIDFLHSECEQSEFMSCELMRIMCVYINVMLQSAS